MRGPLGVRRHDVWVTQLSRVRLRYMSRNRGEKDVSSRDYISGFKATAIAQSRCTIEESIKLLIIAKRLSVKD